MTSRQKWFGASSIVAMGLVLSAGFAGLHWGSSRETAQLRVDWKEGGGKYNVVTGQVTDPFGHPIALLKVTLGCDDGKNSTITNAGGHFSIEMGNSQIKYLELTPGPAVLFGMFRHPAADRGVDLTIVKK